MPASNLETINFYVASMFVRSLKGISIRGYEGTDLKYLLIILQQVTVTLCTKVGSASIMSAKGWFLKVTAKAKLLS